MKQISYVVLFFGICLGNYGFNYEVSVEVNYPELSKNIASNKGMSLPEGLLILI